MKIKGSQLFYLFVVVLVASIYYFDYYKGEQDQKQKEQASILVPILKDEVARVELKNTSGDIEIVRSENGWNLKRPVEDLAATDETDGWVQSLTTEKSMEKIGEGETFEWSTYGLDQPVGTLVVHSKDGNKVQLQISERKNFEGNPFIKRNDEKVVFVGNMVWSSLLTKSVKELREKKILRTPLNELDLITIRQGKGELQFKMQEGKWVAVAKPTWRLDQNKVREVLNVVQDMRATDFVSETDPDRQQQSTYGFANAPLTVSYHFKSGKVWEAAFGQDKTKTWYVWPKDLKKVAKVESSQVEKLTKANLVELRDRELPFLFAKEDVTKVQIAGAKVLELSKEGDAWNASVPGAVETTELNQLLENIRQLRAAEFLDGKATASGIDTAQKQFILTNAEGKNIFELKIGDSFKKREDKTEKTFYYAKTSIYPDVVALKEEDVKTLETDKLIKVEAKPSAEPGNEEKKNP